MNGARTLDCIDEVSVRPVAAFDCCGTTVEAYIAIDISSGQPGSMRLYVCRTQAQAEQLVADLQAAIAAARALPLPDEKNGPADGAYSADGAKEVGATAGTADDPATTVAPGEPAQAEQRAETPENRGGTGGAP